MKHAQLLLLGTVFWLLGSSGLRGQEVARRSQAHPDTSFGSGAKYGKLPPPIDLEALPAASRETVVKVVKNPTLAAISPADEFASSCQLYLWLLDHPDRVSLAWQRMHVTAIDISATADGKFIWRDDQGSELSWKTVVQNADGRVWYAEGKVRPSSVLPVIPVKAVAVLRHGTKTDSDGQTVICHQAEIFLQVDSRAAAFVLRLIGPAAPRMAEEGAEQMLLFFSGIARHLDKHPLRAKPLLAEKK